MGPLILAFSTFGTLDPMPEPGDRQPTFSPADGGSAFVCDQQLWADHRAEAFAMNRELVVAALRSLVVRHAPDLTIWVVDGP